MYRFLRCVVAWGAWGVAAHAFAQITESPVTVQPGHFLLEVDALSLSIDHDDDSRYTAVGAGLAFLTTGLTQNWDVQVGAQLFLSQDYTIEGVGGSESGVGDVYLRTKWRCYESKETWTSVALMPYVKIPTNSGGVGNDSVEGGLIIPWATRVWGDVVVEAMAQVELRRNAADDGYDSYWYGSAAAKRQLTKQIGLYAEAAIAKSSGGEDFEGLLGAGATYALTENMIFDLGMYHGLSAGAADWNYVLRFNLGF
jgi:hypothetical protein